MSPPWLLLFLSAINVLKDREPGAFVIRDSHSFRGAYGLALKVACPPPTVKQSKKGTLWCWSLRTSFGYAATCNCKWVWHAAKIILLAKVWAALYWFTEKLSDLSTGESHFLMPVTNTVLYVPRGNLLVSVLLQKKQNSTTVHDFFFPSYLQAKPKWVHDTVLAPNTPFENHCCILTHNLQWLTYKKSKHAQVIIY